MKHILILIFALLLIGSVAKADQSKDIRVEGHAFSATTLKPLAGVDVELWAFYHVGLPPEAGYSISTDEGGFYRIEITPQITDENNNDLAIGYAFAFICRFGDQHKVQIMPLYKSLTPNQVYHRNVYMQVPANVSSCAGLGN